MPIGLAESGHTDICGGSIADSFNLFWHLSWSFGNLMNRSFVVHDIDLFCSDVLWSLMFLFLSTAPDKSLTEWSPNNTFSYKCFLAARKQFSNFQEIDLLWNTHKILRMPTAGVERQDSFKSVLKDVKRKLSTTQRKNSKQECTKSNGGSPFSSLKSTPFSSNQASPNRSPFTKPK